MMMVVHVEQVDKELEPQVPASALRHPPGRGSPLRHARRWRPSVPNKQSHDAGHKCGPVNHRNMLHEHAAMLAAPAALSKLQLCILAIAPCEALGARFIDQASKRCVSQM